MIEYFASNKNDFVKFRSLRKFVFFVYLKNKKKMKEYKTF
jgi:hypothetical protein